MVQVQSAEALPRVIDRYELLAVLGTGAFATVYRARHTLTRQHVAVKVLRRPDDSAARWLAEARSAASIQHRNVVRVLDCGYAEGEVFLVMDLAEGPTLASVLEQGPLSPHRAVDIALQVLDGLAAAHARGIVHRDIKPPNIVLSRESDGGDLARILDFGVSKELAFDHSATLEGTSIGTPGYMAPELFGDAKTADARADIYAVSAMLYEMLSNRLPFVGRSYEDFVVQVATRRPAPLLDVAPHVPGPLAAAIDRGLARDREARWPSAEAFAAALRGAMLGLAPPASGAFEPTLDVRSAPQVPSTLRTAPPPVVRSSIRSTDRRSRALPIALGVIVLVSVASLVTTWGVLHKLHDSSLAAAAVDTPVSSPESTQSKTAIPPAGATTTAAPATLASAPPAVTSPTPAPAEPPVMPATHGGIKFKFPARVVGQVRATAVDALARRIVPLAQRCRPEGGKPVVCRVDLFVQAEGTISIAKPGSEPGDEATAECLGLFFKETANPSNFAPGGGGIVTVEATLDPR